MKNKEEIEIAESYYERHPLILIISLALTVALVGSCLYLFMYQDFYMHGWALILIPPALYSSFQTLVYILNPYALLYKDKMEVKKNLFSNKFWYFNDIKKVSEPKNGSFVITYNDGDEELLKLKGIKPSHLQKLRDDLHKNVYESLVKRDQLN